MRNIKRFILCLGVFLSYISINTSSVRKMNMCINRDTLVSIAISFLNENYGACDNSFYKIRVCKNSKQANVFFYNPIVYLPQGTQMYYEALVEIDILDSIYIKNYNFNRYSNPREIKLQDHIPFYKETKEYKKDIQFVINAINKSNANGCFERDDFSDKMFIYVEDTCYQINVISTLTESFYNIDKKTGLVYNAGHAHLIAPPVEEVQKEDDPFIELN